MTKKRASPVPTSEGEPDGFRRIQGVSKANAERRSKAAESGPSHEVQAVLPYQPVDAMPARETEASHITETDKREVRHGDTPVEETRAQLRLDVGVMSLEDAGLGQQDGEEVPRKHMRVATVLATDQSRLISGLVTYPAALQFPFPELGRYQLVGLVLLPDKDKVGVTHGDVVNVVP